MVERRQHTNLFLCLLYLSLLLLLHEGRGASSSRSRSSSHDTITASTNHKKRRYLSEEKFLSYEPTTTVTDEAAIDLDMRDIIAELAKGTSQGKENAHKIYSQGSYSQSYAKLSLDDTTNGLPVDLPKGTELLGETSNGRQVLGQTLKDCKRGDAIIEFQYHASTVQEKWTDCHVGGNPNPNLDGCLAPRGSIEIDDLGSFSYTYDPRNHNLNARSLQILSTKANAELFACDDGCPYPSYLKMYEYYGIADYGNRWIMSAFNKTKTNFIQADANFVLYTGDKEEGANEAILKGAVALNVWMYVIGQLEYAQSRCVAAQNCRQDDDDCSNEDRLHAWDRAVAFYTGSEPKTTGYGGYFLYTLAQKRCRNFGTCLATTQNVGMARVNDEIFKLFRGGQHDLTMMNCAQVAENVKRITELMATPLIQGTLRYAYHQDNPPNHDVINKAKTEAEGATYAAAILPFVDACSHVDARTIYDNMRVGNAGITDFAVVKAALERNYDCLGITCDDVGGLVDIVQVGAYMPGAEPCGISTSQATGSTTTTTTSTSSSGTGSSAGTSSNDPNVGLAVGLGIFFVVVFMIVSALLSRKNTNNMIREDYNGTYSTPVKEAEMT